ncbi:MAG: amino acid synthesis family protein, partial [Mesorhizobium sp.]
MKPAIRKIVTYIENTLIEGGKEAPKPLRLISVAAVLTNPWAGRGFTDDLSPEIRVIAPVLGELLTREIIAVAGSGEAIEGYGKAAVCGTAGEIEHASALIHTLHFGNHYRRAVGAKTYLA